jgi:acetyltransferase-like isoleucine patch superfamily enzyme
VGKIAFLIKTIAGIPLRLFSRVSPFALVKGSTIDATSYIGRWTRLYWAEVGRYSYIGRSCTVNKARIGSFCSIAEDCIIGAPAHPTDHVSTSPVFYSRNNVLRTCFNHEDFEEFQQVVIGNDVWIGAKAFIKGGLTIGNGAIIGAHSVVTKNVDDYAIVAGNPARLIRYRFEQDVREKIGKSKWWNWNDEELRSRAGLFSDPSTF